MCFDQTSSFAFAGLGLFGWAGCQFFFKNPYLANGLLFFFTMEFLQGVQYWYIDDCDSLINKALTLVGIVHILFQPYFTHYMSRELSSKSPATMHKYNLVSKLSLTVGLLLGLRMLMYQTATYPPTEANPTTEWLRGNQVCTFSGNFHLAWSVPMADASYLSPGVFLHTFMMFAPFVLIEPHRLLLPGLILFLTGPFMATFITDSMYEQASIWCFFSCAQIIVCGAGHLIQGYNLKTISEQRYGRGKSKKAQ
jgi:hypothetical protein